MAKIYDVAVIGGGINGCGIAADAAMRGLSVALIEKEDIAAKTSSNSSKLIHGGLRYLEYYDFSLVKKALEERQRLLRLAPHLVHPIPFVLPYQKNMRPTWMLRAGLFIYDNISRKNELPHSTLIKRNSSGYFEYLKENFNKGFLFYDCTTDDARLTLCNALQAKEHGASVLLHHQVVSAEIKENRWHLQLCTPEQGQQTLIAKTIVNASGPWVEELNNLLGIATKYKISMVKGSHIVVPALYPGHHAYLLQNKDNRVVFVIPYNGATMIGTTDVIYQGDLDEVSISCEETTYLLELCQTYFKQEVTLDKIIQTWSGVRPLLYKSGTEAQALSRDYEYHLNLLPAPVLSIYGGKITTYRQLACEAVNSLQSIFPHLGHSTTATTPLPGACIGDLSLKEYGKVISKKYAWLDSQLLQRWLQTYGTLLDKLLSNIRGLADLGQEIAPSIYSAEIDYLMDNEWAISAQDVLWRRTKLGLSLDANAYARVDNYIKARLAHQP